MENQKRSGSTRRPNGQRVNRMPADPDTRANRTGAGSPNLNRNRKRARARRRRIRRIILTFIILILIAAAAGAAFLFKKFGTSKEKADLNKYYGIQNETQLAVVVNNTIAKGSGIMSDGHAYVEYSTVRDYINNTFYWDANENMLLYTLPTSVVSTSVGSSEYSVASEKSSEDYVILKTEGNTAYIAADFVQKYTNLEYNVYENPNRIVINSSWGEQKKATIKKDTQVRYQAGVKSPILTEIKKNADVTVIENEGNWKKVRTSDGFIGYVKNSTLKDIRKETVTRPFDEPQYTNISKPYTINLAWHQVTSQTANSSVLETIASTKGLTTISPTWFSITDNSGNISSLASQEYVNYAHQSNIEVWALVDNFNENVNSLELLSRTSSRENLENQLIAQVLQNGIDGINVDFEQLSSETGEHFIQFIRELSFKCRQNNIVLSIDNYVPKGYSSHYHREEQGKVADYVIIMGYDEHFSGSEESGSVASIDFVREGIEATIQQVPAEKVINAVPFYTRLWKEAPQAEGGLTSEALGMAEAMQRVADAGVTPEWNEKVMQDYAQWESGDATYKIWLENARSIEEKLKLMKEYHLAGTAAWKLGFETPDIWDVILKYVN